MLLFLSPLLSGFRFGLLALNLPPQKNKRNISLPLYLFGLRALNLPPQFQGLRLECRLRGGFIHLGAHPPSDSAIFNGG